jgi:hypothetical protein
MKAVYLKQKITYFIHFFLLIFLTGNRLTPSFLKLENYSAPFLQQ